MPSVAPGTECADRPDSAKPAGLRTTASVLFRTARASFAHLSALLPCGGTCLRPMGVDRPATGIYLNSDSRDATSARFHGQTADKKSTRPNSASPLASELLNYEL
jgi:hypothetical protein